MTTQWYTGQIPNGSMSVNISSGVDGITRNAENKLVVAADLIPEVSVGRNLGASTSQWTSGYIQSLYTQTINSLTNLAMYISGYTLNISGGSALNLTSPTTTINGNAVVAGPLSVTQGLGVSQGAVIGTTLLCGSGLTVGGNATLESNATIAGNCTVTGTLTAGTLTLPSAISVTSVNTSGAVTAGSLTSAGPISTTQYLTNMYNASAGLFSFYGGTSSNVAVVNPYYDSTLYESLLVSCPGGPNITMHKGNQTLAINAASTTISGNVNITGACNAGSYGTTGNSFATWTYTGTMPANGASDTGVNGTFSWNKFVTTPIPIGKTIYQIIAQCEVSTYSYELAATVPFFINPDNINTAENSSGSIAAVGNYFRVYKGSNGTVWQMAIVVLQNANSANVTPGTIHITVLYAP